MIEEEVECELCAGTGEVQPKSKAATAAKAPKAAPTTGTSASAGRRQADNDRTVAKNSDGEASEEQDDGENVEGAPSKARGAKARVVGGPYEQYGLTGGGVWWSPLDGLHIEVVLSYRLLLNGAACPLTFIGFIMIIANTSLVVLIFGLLFSVVGIILAWYGNKAVILKVFMPSKKASADESVEEEEAEPGKKSKSKAAGKAGAKGKTKAKGKAAKGEQDDIRV